MGPTSEDGAGVEKRKKDSDPKRVNEETLRRASDIEHDPQIFALGGFKQFIFLNFYKFVF